MTWRCPHCGTPQPEAARCWVCRRSSTCCATCRYFGRAVVSGLGFCLLDRRRTARRGDELEACWTAPPAPTLRSSTVGDRVTTRTNVRSGRTFVPVLPGPELGHAGPATGDGDPALVAADRPLDDSPETGFWSPLDGAHPI